MHLGCLWKGLVSSQFFCISYILIVEHTLFIFLKTLWARKVLTFPTLYIFNVWGCLGKMSGKTRLFPYNSCHIWRKNLVLGIVNYFTRQLHDCTLSCVQSLFDVCLALDKMNKLAADKHDLFVWISFGNYISKKNLPSRSTNKVPEYFKFMMKTI